jgi:sodium-dependent phosphate cotransporter
MSQLHQSLNALLPIFILGKQAGGLISQSDFLSNPIVGVMLGILVTALIQSSSTTTSVIVGLVAGDILNVR